MTVETKSMQEIDGISAKVPVPLGAADAFTAALQGATPVQDYTGGVALVDKAKLEGVPFLIMSYRSHPGVGDGDYLFVRVMLPNGVQVGFNDGGMGIPPVLLRHSEIVGGDVDDSLEVVFPSPLYCPRGLHPSPYKNTQGIDSLTYWIA